MELVTNGLAGLASVVLAYAVVLIIVRLAGRRTISQMSAFDAVITIALGSLLAQTATSGTGMVRGLAAIAGLVALQAAIAWARRRWYRVERWVDFAPRVVVADGAIRRENLKGGIDGPQMTVQELKGRLRAAGVRDVDDVVIAVLESTGGISVFDRQPVDDTRVPDLWRDRSPSAGRSDR